MRLDSRTLRIAACVVLVVCGACDAGSQTPNRITSVPQFFQYSLQELQAYEAALKPRMNQYKQAAEQLGDFGNHTAWIAHREADGLVEIHQNWSDLVFVVSGTAALRVGGEIDAPSMESPGEVRGTVVRGGTVRQLRQGDVVNVPAGVSHQFLVQPGQQITFFTMKIARVP
jgi:hypothetical protein